MRKLNKSTTNLILFVFFIGGFGVQLQAAADPMNVLFIGNSYTHYNDMPEILESIAVSKGVKVNVEMSAKSNHTCRMHCQRADMFDKISSRKWDYVVLQGFSRELTHEPDYLDTSFVPFFNQIIDSIYTNNPCTNVLLYRTWGYKNGIADHPDLDSYQKMSDKIALGYQYIADLYSLPIVPVGEVWETIYKNHPTINLYLEDNQHPNLYGSFLIASCFYVAIFKATPVEGFVPKKMDAKEAKIIQQSAYNFISSNISKYKLRQNTLEVKYERTAEGKYVVSCKSFYPNAMSTHWDFGDGTSSELPAANHYYKMAGVYSVILTVKDYCGDRVIYRKVYFKEPKKPTKHKPSVPVTSSGKRKKI
jgi:hypothetical protein